MKTSNRCHKLDNTDNNMTDFTGFLVHESVNLASH